jgi:histone deacetylase complex subunit SAP30
MARKREKRRVSKEQLALAVRRSFKDQAVSESDVVCEFVYRVRNRDNAFRLRSAPLGVVKK